MRGVFDEQGVEPVRPSRDTELTLGTGAVLGIIAGLVLLCGVFFAMGYGLGHSSSSAPPSLRAPQPATEQEPLQANGIIPKPSATVQTAVAQPPESAEPSESGAPTETATPAVAAVAANGSAVQPEVHAALPVMGGAPQNSGNGAAQLVHPVLSSAQASPQGQQFMVQIAAISNTQDAEALVNALKKRNYPVVSKRDPADDFIHVRIGPFATRPIADQWRLKLLNDGYNAQVQP
jgi:DedD protein